jgi:hypothetical protein
MPIDWYNALVVISVILMKQRQILLITPWWPRFVNPSTHNHLRRAPHLT